jgi:hypothetical protein
MKTNTCTELHGARPANPGSQLISWRSDQSPIVVYLTATVLFLSLMCSARAQCDQQARPDDICHPWTGNVDAFTYGNGVGQQLLGDPAFREGFRAFWTAKAGEIDGPSGWTGDWTLKLGTIKDNYPPSRANTYYNKNYTIHAWPDTAPYTSSGTYADAGKSWNFNEGLHENYTDAGGHAFPTREDGTMNADDPWNPATDLMAHRIEANVETAGFGYGSDGKLNEIFLEHKNNLPIPYGIQDEAGNPALVRTVWAKNGAMYTYMNTRNELRNIAALYDPIYKLDTWPHFYLEQNFKKLVDLATLSVVQFSANLRVWDVTGPPTNDYRDASYGVGFTLRNKRTPTTVVFLGYSLYSWNGVYGPIFDTDQNGQISYRGNPTDLGGALVPDSNNAIFAGGRTIGINLPELFIKARDAAGASQFSDPKKEASRIAFLQSTVEDYYLAAVGIGWETVGWEEVRSQISNVWLLGYPSPFFDSEVYQDGAYQAYYNFPWAWDGAEGMRRAHWAKYGSQEGWVASPTFDVKIYMKKWGALGPDNVDQHNYMPQCYNNGTPNYGCGIVDYVVSGRNAGHFGHN